jgi:hypothetical protein
MGDKIIRGKVQSYFCPIYFGFFPVFSLGSFDERADKMEHKIPGILILADIPFLHTEIP